MATIKLNLDGIVKAVQAMINLSTDMPSSTSDDYLTIKEFANKGISRWQDDNGTLWNELWTTTDDYSTGAELTIATNKSSYATPNNFRFPGGFVITKDANGNETKHLVIKPHQKQTFSSQSSAVYFTGNPSDGYKLNFIATPTSEMNGHTIYYPYYKFATRLENGSDTPEMSDPYFLVDFVASEMVREEDPQRWQTLRRDAEEKLKEMEIKNAMSAHYQTDNAEDAHAVLRGFILGED